MAIKSMTGFGRGEGRAGGLSVTVEISSVNRKQLDIRLNLPRPLAVLEPKVLKQVGTVVTRGGVAVTAVVVWVDAAKRGSVSLDYERAAGYIDALRSAGKALGLSGDMSLDILLRLPDVITCEDAAQDRERVWSALQRALREALRGLLAMRVAEGKALEADLRKRLGNLRKSAGKVSALAPSVVQHYRKLLEARIAAMNLKGGPAEDVVAREVALFADRCDISEELVRLNSHFDQAESLMTQREPAGRALDFLCQEILREINTIGSKANDARLARHVVEMKAALECFREQVQNVE